VIRLGTRASALALAQARHVASLLGDEVELVEVTTSGDRGAIGDKARFVKELEDALLDGRVDLAVHSAKDVPATLPDGCSIVGVPARADPRDALCGAASLADLSAGAVVGTASVRRRSQLLAHRPDLRVEELRGNVDTRLRKLVEGRYDAIVLAVAGLERLGRGDEGRPLALAELVPCPGQGCLVLEARSDDPAMAVAAGALTDSAALRALTAERALVGALDATCNTPVGALATEQDGDLGLRAYVGLPDGSHWIADVQAGDPATPAALGERVAARLLEAGARELLGEAERMASGEIA
jgi:hydroxymethylbilane synthase